MIELWLFLSAFAAGVMNAIAGGGTLLTFPALLAAGLPHYQANITSTLALAPGSIAGTWGYRSQLSECGRWVWLLSLPSLVGGAIGSLLLIWFPDVFRFVVPWLVLLAAVLFFLQPHLSGWILKNRPLAEPSSRALGIILFCQLLIGIYGGYFGAGIGIMMLTSLGFLGLPSIHQMNALKTFLAFIVNAVSVVFFIASGQIQWRYGLIMAVAAIAGGYCGARFALRLKPIYVRWIVIVIGFSMAAFFFWKQMTDQSPNHKPESQANERIPPLALQACDGRERRSIEQTSTSAVLS